MYNIKCLLLLYVFLYRQKYLLSLYKKIYLFLITHTHTMFKLFNDKSIQLIFLDKLYFSTTFNSLLLVPTLSN